MITTSNKNARVVGDQRNVSNMVWEVWRSVKRVLEVNEYQRNQQFKAEIKDGVPILIKT